jgi:hypothetical protein
MPTFETIAKYAAAGCLLKPLLVQFHTSGEAFRLMIETAKPLERKPDGWFHASTHPGLTEGQLITYLTMPVPEKAEDFGYLGRMSVLVGTIMGEVNRQALIQLGLMVPVQRGTCRACGLEQPKTCREHGASHPGTRSRGHLDGIVRFGPPSPVWRGTEDVWGYEGKTIKNVILAKAPDMDEEFFRQRWPAYWWQVQEYMRLTGLRRFIVLFQGIGNPWDLREYHVQADPEAAYQIEMKYRSVLAHVGITPR